MKGKIRYKDAGVDISAGEEAVLQIKQMVRTTFSSHVLTDIGKFGGFFELDLTGYKNPILVSSIDGVGTKLKVAFMAKRHDTIGEDLVNHCVNDILSGGAFPLFFLDYIGTGKLTPEVMEQIVAGMVIGCREAGCSLIGGEMAEMPGIYKKGEYDVAGAIVGLVEKEKIIDGSRIKAGDILVGLPSSGLHTNGYSLARKVLFERSKFKVDTYIDDLGETIGESLLRVHRCYLNITKIVLNHIDIHGMSHITGGGLVSNTNRILPENLQLEIDWMSWIIPPIFQLIREKGNVPVSDWRKTFNLGIGYVYIVDPKSVDPLIQIFNDAEENPIIFGRVVKKD
jgi:phosphoribosylformylglycinamidine cyclo-ligase